MSRYQPVIVKKEIDTSHYYWVGMDEQNLEFVPSVTKILHEGMPTPLALKMWLMDVGAEKAEKKLNDAGARGSMLHDMCESLLLGNKIESKTISNERDKKCVASFINWCAEYQPEIKEQNHIEFIVASTLGYAGTMDIFCTIKGEPYIVDIKTSANIYPEHMLQITAYQEAFYEMTEIKAKRAILHLNPLTKKGYNFIEKIEIKKKPVTISDFICAFDMYKMINGGIISQPPKITVYPELFELTKQ